MKKISAMRKQYIGRLIGRCLIFIGCRIAAIKTPEIFEILEGKNFFHGFSILHLLWLVWMIDMLFQIVPLKNQVALGSQKLFSCHFKPAKEQIDESELKKLARKSRDGAVKVLVLWSVLIAVIGFLYHQNVIHKTGMFLISVFFYVCDLICVLIWCPFRLIMKNKCCTTCRIFNWDHLMMFSPLIFIGGFYAISLVVTASAAWILWEVFVVLYPERFFEKTNASLKCANCTEKLCTQYCQKRKNQKNK